MINFLPLSALTVGKGIPWVTKLLEHKLLENFFQERKNLGFPKLPISTSLLLTVLGKKTILLMSRNFRPFFINIFSQPPFHERMKPHSFFLKFILM